MGVLFAELLQLFENRIFKKLKHKEEFVTIYSIIHLKLSKSFFNSGTSLSWICSGRAKKLLRKRIYLVDLINAVSFSVWKLNFLRDKSIIFLLIGEPASLSVSSSSRWRCSKIILSHFWKKCVSALYFSWQPNNFTFGYKY